MPEEIVAIIIVAIIMGTVSTLVKVILGHKEKMAGLRPAERARSSAESSSVTTSELERMFERVVDKATGPILDRLEDLEDRIDAGKPLALPSKGERLELDLDQEPVVERESAMASPRKRSR